MRTKQWIFRCAAALTAGIAALTGCTVDNTVQKPDDNKAYDNVRFVVNMAEKPSIGDGDSDTRALKAGWTEGDAIIVFLDGTVNNWAHLVYTDGDWILRSKRRAAA